MNTLCNRQLAEVIEFPGNRTRPGASLDPRSTIPKTEVGTVLAELQRAQRFGQLDSNYQFQTSTSSGKTFEWRVKAFDPHTGKVWVESIPPYSQDNKQDQILNLPCSKVPSDAVLLGVIVAVIAFAASLGYLFNRP